MTPSLSLVVAAHGNIENLAPWLEAVRPQVAQLATRRGLAPEELVEVWVCRPADEPETALPAAIADGGESEWLHPVHSGDGALVPRLWRDGIERSRSSRVALGVVDCLPEPDWLEALLEADLGRYCAIGGAIDCGANEAGVGLAVYLLRYARYARPFAPLETVDLPGDNALYDRAALLPHAAAYAEGFWEPEIHARLQRDGRRLLRDPGLAVRHHNTYGALEFASQRLAHGRHFGRDRASAMPWLRRVLYLAASPAVPLVLGIKVFRVALANPATRAALPRAAPSLMLFLLAWGAGEMRGVLDAVVGRREST